MELAPEGVELQLRFMNMPKGRQVVDLAHICMSTMRLSIKRNMSKVDKGLLKASTKLVISERKWRFLPVFFSLFSKAFLNLYSLSLTVRDRDRQMKGDLPSIGLHTKCLWQSGVSEASIRSPKFSLDLPYRLERIKCLSHPLQCSGSAQAGKWFGNHVGRTTWTRHSSMHHL